MVVTGGQRNDGAMLTEVLTELHVPRIGGSSDIRWGGHGVSPPAVRSMRRR